MSRLILAVLGLGVCAWTAFAQSEVEAQANVILPDGRRNLVVSNRSSKTSRPSPTNSGRLLRIGPLFGTST